MSNEPDTGQLCICTARLLKFAESGWGDWSLLGDLASYIRGEMGSRQRACPVKDSRSSAPVRWAATKGVDYGRARGHFGCNDDIRVVHVDIEIRVCNWNIHRFADECLDPTAGWEKKVEAYQRRGDGEQNLNGC